MHEEKDKECSSHCVTTGDSNETSTELNNCLLQDVNNTQLDVPCVRGALSPAISLLSSSAAMEADSSTNFRVNNNWHHRLSQLYFHRQQERKGTFEINQMRKMLKTREMALQNFANFVSNCIARGNCYYMLPKMVLISMRKYKYIQNVQAVYMYV